MLTVAREPAHDRGDPGGQFDLGEACRSFALVARGHEQEALGAGAGRVPTHIGEVVRPGVDELEHVVAAVGIGDVQGQRRNADVDLGDRSTACRCSRSRTCPRGPRAWWHA